MFKNTIVRTPCKNLVNGLTTAQLGQPGYKKALIQHKNYINALKKFGIKATILDAGNRFVFYGRCGTTYNFKN